MSYYKGFVSEFIESNYCHDKTSAEAILSIFNYEKLFDIIIEDSKFELEDVLLLEDIDLEIHVKSNIDSILNGIYKKSASEEISALNYITSMVMEKIPEEEKDLFTNHKNRKAGELYESTMAGILYSGFDKAEVISDDYVIMHQLLSILILELIETMKDWMKADSGNSEIHKIISKFLLSEPSINKKYILELIELIGINGFFDKVKSSGDIQSKDLMNHYAISEADVSILSIANKEDVLLLIHSATAKQPGAFLALSRSVDMPESVFSHQTPSKEIQAAKIFKRGSDDDRSFWISIGILAIRLMSEKFNNFRASSAAHAPAPADII